MSFNTPDNFPVFRYSGALLLLAECLAEQGKEPEALPYLNEVRDRAGLDDLGVATKGEYCYWKCAMSWHLKNHRWLDLVSHRKGY